MPADLIYQHERLPALPDMSVPQIPLPPWRTLDLARRRTLVPRDDSWFLRLMRARMLLEQARRLQPSVEGRPVDEERPREAAAQATSPDPADPNSRGCRGPYTRVLTYTRAEFFTSGDRVTDQTPVR
jgi:hypothetical protein